MRQRTRPIRTDDCPRSVIELVDVVHTDRQCLLVDIRLAASNASHLAIAVERFHRADLVVRERIGIAREREVIAHIAPRLCGRACLCLLPRLCRGIGAIIAAVDCKLNLILVAVNNARQIRPCHCIGKYRVRLRERVLAVILLDEMRRELGRKITLRDRIACMLDALVTPAIELEVLRIDRHIIVDARSVCDAFVIVLCSRECDIVKVDRHGVSAAEIERTRLEALLEMRQILIGLPALHILNILCAIVFLRGVADIEIKVIDTDRALADRPLAVRRIRDRIVVRVCAGEHAADIRILHVLATLDHIAIRVRDNVRIFVERRVGIARTVEARHPPC